MNRPTTLEGWGRIPLPGSEHLSVNLENITRGAAISRGLGRSYGDSSLPARPEDKVAGTRLADRILSFDPTTGLVCAEAGLSLANLNRVFLPRGWFSPVTPGTKLVTLGGMVASDVHGKNHHIEGCFGAHVSRLRIQLGNGDIVFCGPTENPDLFHGSVGGMGLLGHILDVEFPLRRIPSQWIWKESERVHNINDFLAALGDAAGKWPMTMGWIDCLSRGRSLGRGILMAGRWATVDEVEGRLSRTPTEHTLPFELPDWALNRWSAKAFNFAYYWTHLRRRQAGLVSPDSFFYPLDAVLHWNRAYGPRGFTQYQCVLPRSAGAAAVRDFLKHVTRLGYASPLCVIKDCGPQGQGVLSFPMEGTSVAVDMAVWPDIQKAIDHLNEFVVAAGGRIYLTKDQFTRADHFQAMEPRLGTFLAAREQWDPARKLRSAQSARLFGDMR